MKNEAIRRMTPRAAPICRVSSTEVDRLVHHNPLFDPIVHIPSAQREDSYYRQTLPTEAVGSHID